MSGPISTPAAEQAVSREVLGEAIAIRYQDALEDAANLVHDLLMDNMEDGAEAKRLAALAMAAIRGLNPDRMPEMRHD